jgi:hypothetical protein
VPCKTFANVAGAVSLDGLPSTNAQQRARTSIRKHYPPDVGTSKKSACSCALDLDGFFMFVGEFVKSERKQPLNSCLDISNLVKMEDGIFE